MFIFMIINGDVSALIIYSKKDIILAWDNIEK